MKVWGYILLIVLFVGAFLAGRWTKPCGAPESVRRDTVILHDTLAVPVPTPERVEVIRRDTCWLMRCDTVLMAGTLRVPVVGAIEQKVYATADYRAVVEG